MRNKDIKSNSIMRILSFCITALIFTAMFSVAFADTNAPIAMNHASTVYAIEDDHTGDITDAGAKTTDDTKGAADAPGTDEAPEQSIPVKDIEIGTYKKEIMIDETVDLSAKVIPNNAAEQEITYRSMDEDVATVDSKGQIKGVDVGKATIVLRAGMKEKSLKITVLGAKTDSITLNKDYLVLKPGVTFKISAQIMPANAIRKLTYQSWNTKIASVSKSGVIKAAGTGSTFIIVTNGDMTTSVSIIVSKSSTAGSRDIKSSMGTGTKSSKAEESDTDETDTDIISQIRESDVGVAVSQRKYPVITKAVLKVLSEQKSLMTVESDGYTLIIDGSDIVNPENELSTQIDFANKNNDIVFTMNNARNMPGKVALILKGTANKAYLYLYSKAKGKYQRLDGKVGPALMIDEAGKYLLSDEKLGALTLKMKWVIGAGALILIGIIVFIVIRKKYWFW